MVSFQFWWHFSLGDISVLVTFQFWWPLCHFDTSVLVKLKFCWYFSISDISVFKTFQFWRQFNYVDISVLVTFHVWWQFSFGEISVLLNFRFSGILVMVSLSIFESQSNIAVSPALQLMTKQSKIQPNNFMNIVLISLFVELDWIVKSGKWQLFLDCSPLTCSSACGMIASLSA